MGLSDVLLVILGTCGVTEWLRHDHRLQRMREKMQASSYSGLRQVAACGFCMSHWAGICVVGIWALYTLPLHAWFNPLTYLFLAVAVFAATRGANLLHDVFREHSRTPSTLKIADPNDPSAPPIEVVEE